LCLQEQTRTGSTSTTVAWNTTTAGQTAWAALLYGIEIREAAATDDLMGQVVMSCRRKNDYILKADPRRVSRRRSSRKSGDRSAPRRKTSSESWHVVRERHRYVQSLQVRRRVEPGSKTSARVLPGLRRLYVRRM